MQMEKMRGSASRWIAGGASVMAALALTACGGGGGDSTSASAGGTGTLQVSMTDAPSCGYDHVWVTVQKVRVTQSASASDSDAGWQDIALATPQRIDLLNLTNGVMQSLGSTSLPAGDYQQVRLVLADNSSGQDPMANAVQPTGGQPIAMQTPSAQQSGLKLQSHFTVQAGQQSDLLIDFDACRSVVKAGQSGRYILKPVLRVTPQAQVTSSIQGYVTTTLTLSATTVSAQQNGSVVRSTTPDASGKFVLSSLPDGTYTVVVTSDQHATGVVSNVPLNNAAGSTTLNGTATAIVLPSSTMGTVTGTVTASTTTGTSTSTTTAVVSDATVTALQSVNGANIDVASTPVDLDLGTYKLSLPSAAPVLAPYASAGLTFTPNGTGGSYTLQAVSPTKGTKTNPATVTGGATTTVNFAY
jgi:hypothetical protein